MNEVAVTTDRIKVISHLPQRVDIFPMILDLRFKKTFQLNSLWMAA